MVRKKIANKTSPPGPPIDARILLLRGQKVMLDADLAELYDVPTKRLNEQIKRNAARFPSDFMFQITTNEKAEVVANCDHLARLKFSPVLPYAFTEHGALMVANVLNSPRAVEASVYVIRAFIRFREVLASNAELAKKLDTLEKKLSTHDQAITGLINAIRQLTAPQTTKRRTIGFVHDD